MRPLVVVVPLIGQGRFIVPPCCASVKRQLAPLFPERENSEAEPFDVGVRFSVPRFQMPFCDGSVTLAAFP